MCCWRWTSRIALMGICSSAQCMRITEKVNVVDVKRTCPTPRHSPPLIQCSSIKVIPVARSKEMHTCQRLHRLHYSKIQRKGQDTDTDREMELKPESERHDSDSGIATGRL